MSGFSAFLTKELNEIMKTWRIWVVPGMLLFFAVTSPVLALLTPALVSSVAQSQPGVTITVPPATWTDAYGQFLKSLNQIVLIAVVITGAGAISGERASGTAVLTLTKPIARSAFVLAKILSQSILLVTFSALGAIVCVVLTRVIFGPAPLWPFAYAVLLWLTYALLLVVVMTVFSAWFPARGAAAGGGLAFHFLVLLIGIWSPAVRYSFAGVLPAAGKALVGQPVAVFWPLMTAVAMSIVSTAAAVRIFERQELCGFPLDPSEPRSSQRGVFLLPQSTHSAEATWTRKRSSPISGPTNRRQLARCCREFLKGRPTGQILSRA